MIRGIEQAQKVHYMQRNRFFNANTPTQFKAHGVEIEFNHFVYECAMGFDNVVIRATRKTGGWFELILDRETTKSWRCDGNIITENMI